MRDIDIDDDDDGGTGPMAGEGVDRPNMPHNGVVNPLCLRGLGPTWRIGR